MVTSAPSLAMLSKRVLVVPLGILTTAFCPRRLAAHATVSYTHLDVYKRQVYDGTAAVEGILCRRIDSLEECEQVWQAGEIPLMVDPAGDCMIELSAQGKVAALVDAILAKRNLGTSRNMAPLTIGLGPGFFAGEDVDYVVETMRGHDLARIITEGPAIPNTGVPGMVGGVSKERVIHSPGVGRIHNMAHIADIVAVSYTHLNGASHSS